MRSAGRTDAAGNYEGVTVVQGDVNGVPHVTSSPASFPTATYEGVLVVQR
jgi:hypothetical protein